MNGLATLRYLALPFHPAPLLLVALFSVMLRLAELARALLRDFDRHYPNDPSALRVQRLAQELAR